MERSKQNRGADSIRDVRDRAREVVVDLRETYSTSEVAEVLDVSKATVHRWGTGSLPVRRIAQEIVGDRASIEDRLAHNRAQRSR